MLSRCLFCRNDFQRNESLERFPLGRRVAYDPERGRLWTICDACARWSLAPIEDRWEALEDMERVARDGARLLAETENIALLQKDDIEMVRVGKSGLREEAWWRYGRELLRRREDSLRVAGRGRWLDFTVAVLLFGIPWLPKKDPESHWVHRQRDRRFGSHLLRTRQECPRCGSRWKRLTFHDRHHLVLGPGEDGGLELWRHCGRCGWYEDTGGFRVQGGVAQHLLRRMMAYHNYSGASQPELREAVRIVSEQESPARLVRAMAAERIRPGTLDPARAVALELALSEDAERRLLRMELEEIEEHWRHEEEIAAIVDGELTPAAIAAASIPAPTLRRSID